MDTQTALREHLFELLDGRSAHIGLEAAIRGFPMNLINERMDDTQHSPWELLEHIRLAQWDIVEFCRDPKHVSPDFPDGYWTLGNASVIEWERSVEQILADLEAMKVMVADIRNDLFAPIPHGDGQTLLREAMLVADHNSYHLGQLMQLKKTLEAKVV
ncbi:MAG: DinB family protein [Pyrinomonadaceae bacterium]|nr:DinB family protein [Pyrinomonadaceae bacterium]